MKICYLDEAGCTGVLPHAASDVQPVLVIAGIIVDYNKLHGATEALMDLKRKFYPTLCPTGRQYLQAMLVEVKGGELRKNACSSSRNIRRHVFGFLNGIMDICEAAEIKLIGRVWIKGIGKSFHGTPVYTYSTQAIYDYFHDYLSKTNDLGIVIADSRVKHLNSQVAHSIFTKKFKGSGDAYQRILELPSFSHSDNHAGLQLCDAICSAILFPLAVHAYCAGHVNNVHVRPGYSELKRLYASEVNRMQHRYQEISGKWKGGVVVSDDIANRPGNLLFR